MDNARVENSDETSNEREPCLSPLTSTKLLQKHDQMKQRTMEKNLQIATEMIRVCLENSTEFPVTIHVPLNQRLLHNNLEIYQQALKLCVDDPEEFCVSQDPIFREVIFIRLRKDCEHRSVNDKPLKQQHLARCWKFIVSLVRCGF
jgi:hypothetical protein